MLLKVSIDCKMSEGLLVYLGLSIRVVGSQSRQGAITIFCFNVMAQPGFAGNVHSQSVSRTTVLPFHYVSVSRKCFDPFKVLLVPKF